MKTLALPTRYHERLFYGAIWAVCFIACWMSPAFAAPLSEHDAIARMSTWMQGHPVMGAAAERELKSVISFPSNGAPYTVYVVSLKPSGYAVLNSDDLLPLVVGFSASSAVSLEDLPDNTFRVALLAYVEQTHEKLTTMDPKSPADRSYLRAPGLLSLTDELYGPYLKTSWNQNHPYNLYCPADPSGSQYNGYRVPAGCVIAAYAQVLNYHRWPLYGQGTHSYTDTGDISGPHSADFSEPFNWSAMRTTYDAYPSAQTGSEEVADLMYRLGVAADINYESGGCSASMETLGERITKHLFYEEEVYADNQATLLPALDADLRAGFPGVVAVPGHAIVADGLMSNSGTVSYHINYGWGGVNNGWWSADGVPGGAISRGCTSIRPALMAFPKEQTVSAVADEPIELNWILPVRRETEASCLWIRQLAQQGGTWSSSASDLAHTASSGWSSHTGGRSGNCWYAGPNGYAALTLVDDFVPDTDTSLSFWMKYRLGTATFTVSVSTDGGETFTVLLSKNNNLPLLWELYAVPLSAYAGQKIRLRFELSSGSYYPDTGGVWLDDLSLNSGDWYRWVDFAQDTELASRRFSEQTSVLDTCSDFSTFKVTSTGNQFDWAITTNGSEHYFYKQPNTIWSGKYHLTSTATITPDANTRLLLRWKRKLGSDRLRILASLNGTTFTEIWSEGGISDWTEQTIPLGAYAGQAIYLRLEYTVGSYYSDGGVWIDTISLQEVQNLELEGQPIYYTILPNLPAGTYTLASVIEDTEGHIHAISPLFQLSVTSPYTYRIEADGSVTLTSFHSSGTRLEIPAVLDGRSVSGIDSNALSSASLVSLTIPGSVTNLHANAFTGASALQRVYFTGDAPMASSTLLSGTSATVYYLPNTTGWGATFGGRPAKLWNPTVVRDPTFGFTAGRFGFTISGTPLIPIDVQATDALPTGVWQSITNTTLNASGSLMISDPASSEQPTRFYHFVFP